MPARITQVAFQRSGRNVVSNRIDVDEDRRRPDAAHATSACEKGVIARNHRVAWPEAHGHKDREKRIGAGRNADRVGRSAVACNRRFKFCNLRSENKVLAREDFLDLSPDWVRQGCILLAEVEQRDAHRLDTMAVSSSGSKRKLAWGWLRLTAITA